MSPQPNPRTAPVRTGGPLRFSYGTNGLTDLRLDDALALLADLGYDGVGLTLDHMHLDPLAPDLTARTRRIARRLGELGLGVTVETGARYVLDPARKHGPSLLDPDPEQRARRVDLLVTAVRVAADLGAQAVHCFSGIRPETAPGQGAPAPEAVAARETPGAAHATATHAGEWDTGGGPRVGPAGAHQGGPAGEWVDDVLWKRLGAALDPVLDAATDAGVPLAVEPEPGHLLATLADFHRLRAELGGPDALGLTLDIGHCQCLEPRPPADCVRAAAPWLRHVQIEDMRRGVHEHLPFGEGEIDFPPVLEALADVGYQGLVSVELPRHSHAGPDQARRSLPFLHRAAATVRPRSADRPIPGESDPVPEGRTP
ncbi:sugar phosphate isomerase/epimerase family protein [Streptomyces fructofermentans]|uniref:Xylose isomerase n=1 Tax=Streptomyces fructofermentans TaxID=152141 RepID=A0A918NSW4_9ACTN|nr:sugar phosphate isomerase/epimerase family protein [Streptomyces fructofermentans]GGX92807.1 xylose isomerase [Streptomyces fructofermentans]